MEKDQFPVIEKVCYICGFVLDDFPYNPGGWPRGNEAIICPSCGMHYGFDDEGAGFIIPDELAYSDWKFGDDNHKKIIRVWREHWMRNGMTWWSQQPKPEGWDPMQQLKSIPDDFR